HPGLVRPLQRQRLQVSPVHPQRGLRRRFRHPAHAEGRGRLPPRGPGGRRALVRGTGGERDLSHGGGARDGRARPYRGSATHRGVGGHRTAVQVGRSCMTRIGFIGVGTMGLPMATNLVKKGFTVTAYDVNAEALKAATSAGMTMAASAAEAGAGADIVGTMLPASPPREQVYGGDGGIINAARRGTLCIDMSTIDPAASRRVAAVAAERGVRFVDAPVSGGTPRAIDGTLAIMVGASAEDFQAAKPALDAM